MPLILTLRHLQVRGDIIVELLFGKVLRLAEAPVFIADGPLQTGGRSGDRILDGALAINSGRIGKSLPVSPFFDRCQMKLASVLSAAPQSTLPSIRCPPRFARGDVDGSVDQVRPASAADQVPGVGTEERSLHESSLGEFVFHPCIVGPNPFFPEVGLPRVWSMDPCPVW
jgi:hypothetical protein